MRRVPILVLALLAMATVRAEGPPDEVSRLRERIASLEREQEDEVVRRGAVNFARNCAACHGREGQGDGPGAADLDPAPRDLTSTRYRFRSTPSGSPPRDEDVKRTIRLGLPGSAMPAFGDLFSDEELDAVVRFLGRLHGQEAPDAFAVPAVGSATAESVADGRVIYLLMGCWSCHGTDGAGHGSAAKGLTDENDRPIRATNFRRDPLKGGREPTAVARVLLTGLNGTPMPSYADALLFAREEIEDVSALAGSLDPAELEAVSAYARASPSRAEVSRLDTAGRTALRDLRLTALTHYVLSLDRRSTAGFRLFAQEPEREARRP